MEKVEKSFNDAVQDVMLCLTTRVACQKGLFQPSSGNVVTQDVLIIVESERIWHVSKLFSQKAGDMNLANIC